MSIVAKFYIYIEPRHEKNKIQRLKKIEIQLSTAKAIMLLQDQVVVVDHHHRHHYHQFIIKIRYQNGLNRQVNN